MWKSSTGPAPAWQAGWARRAVTDRRFTAETIARVVAADTGARTIPELCASEGIAVDTYYVWKLAYAGLTADEVRQRREGERNRARGTTAIALAALVVFAVGAGTAAVARWNGPPDPEPMARTAPASAPESVPRPVPAAVVAGPTAATATPAAAIPVAAEDDLADETAAAEGTATEQEVAAPRSGYRLQVLAAPDREEAEAWLARLRQAGYSAQLTSTLIDRTPMYRVRIGPVPTREEAEHIRQRLEREGYPEPWLVR
jgi:cell division septation protein DedD